MPTDFRAPFTVPAEHVRYAAVAQSRDVVSGYRDGWISVEDATRLAFLRRCDMTDKEPGFAQMEALTPGTPQYDKLGESIAGQCDFDRGFWEYAAASWCYSLAPSERDQRLRVLAELAGSPDLADVAADPAGYAYAWLGARKKLYLLDRVAFGDGMNWQDSSALMGIDRPEEIDSAFDLGEKSVGVAIIGLALNHPDPQRILPRIARTLASDSGGELRSQGIYVPHRRLPWWLWRHKLVENWRWRLWGRWIS